MRGATRLDQEYARIYGMFQSTRPCGARLDSIRDELQYISFNPRAHAGRDGQESDCVIMIQSFNPRAHAGCDQKQVYFFMVI